MFEPTKQAIIREHKVEKRESRVIPVLKRKSFSDILKDAQHNLINSKINGRIFFKSRSGKYVATNVSPYSDKFESNIEPGVLKSILNLKSKGYLTLSSCQGHCTYSKRYITLAFYSKDRAEQFIKDLNVSSFKYLIFKPEEYMNTSYVIENDRVVDVVDNKNHDKKDCIMSLNSIFERNYGDYTLLEIQFSNQISKFSFKEFLYKNFFIWFYTKLFERKVLKMPYYEM